MSHSGPNWHRLADVVQKMLKYGSSGFIGDGSSPQTPSAADDAVSVTLRADAAAAAAADAREHYLSLDRAGKASYSLRHGRPADLDPSPKNSGKGKRGGRRKAT
jgi:hypothetical protein